MRSIPFGGVSHGFCFARRVLPGPSAEAAVFAQPPFCLGRVNRQITARQSKSAVPAVGCEKPLAALGPPQKARPLPNFHGRSLHQGDRWPAFIHRPAHFAPPCSSVRLTSRPKPDVIFCVWLNAVYSAFALAFAACPETRPLPGRALSRRKAGGSLMPAAGCSSGYGRAQRILRYAVFCAAPVLCAGAVFCAGSVLCAGAASFVGAVLCESASFHPSSSSTAAKRRR